MAASTRNSIHTKEKENLMRRITLGLMLAIWLSPSWAVDEQSTFVAAAYLGLAVAPASSPVVARDPQSSLVAYRAETWRNFRVIPEGQIEFDLKGLSIATGGSGYIGSGQVRASYFMSDGKEYWLLVPYTETGRLDGRKLNSADSYTSAPTFVGVNYASGEIFPRIVRLKLTVPQHLLKPNNKSLAFSREIQLTKAARIRREGYFSEDARNRAVLEFQSVDQTNKASNRRLVTKIGTKICVSNATISQIGFTEGRSPDSDKIQIRLIVSRLAGEREYIGPGGSAPTLIWDDPDRWHPCD
jgi:hypothetical protein